MKNKWKKMLIVLPALVCMACLTLFIGLYDWGRWDGAISASTSTVDGSDVTEATAGTEANPVTFSAANDITANIRIGTETGAQRTLGAWMGQYRTGGYHFRLTGDISLATAIPLLASGNVLDGGIYNENGVLIGKRKITFRNTGTHAGIGLFQNLQGTVKNLDMAVEITGSHASSVLRGAVAGTVARTASSGNGSTINASIENVHVSGSIRGTRVGGLVGAVGPSTGNSTVVSTAQSTADSVTLNITNCTNSASVGVPVGGVNISANDGGAGGLVGYVWRSTLNIANSENTGNITFASTINNGSGTTGIRNGVGGLVGNVHDSAGIILTAKASNVNITMSRNKGAVVYAKSLSDTARTGASTGGSGGTFQSAGGLIGLVSFGAPTNVSGTYGLRNAYAPSSTVRIGLNVDYSYNWGLVQIIAYRSSTPAYYGDYPYTNQVTTAGGLIGQAFGVGNATDNGGALPGPATITNSYNRYADESGEDITSNNAIFGGVRALNDPGNISIYAGGILARAVGSYINIDNCFNTAQLYSNGLTGRAAYVDGIVASATPGHSNVNMRATVNVTNSANAGDMNGNGSEETGHGGIVTDGIGGGNEQGEETGNYGTTDGSTNDDIDNIIDNVTEEVTDAIETAERGKFTVTVPADEENYAFAFVSRSAPEPSEPDTVYGGDEYTFTVTVDDGFRNKRPDITVSNGQTLSILPASGSAADGVYTCTITDITGSTAISVSGIEHDAYDVTLNAGTEYTIARINGSGPVTHGSPFEFRVTVDAAYNQYLPEITSDGSAVTTAPDTLNPSGQYEYKIDSVTEDTTISVGGLELNEYTVTPPADEAGFTFNATSSITVQHGGTFTFSVTASAHYNVTGVTRTGGGNAVESLGNNSYRITNITSNVTAINVTAVKKTYTVTGPTGLGFTYSAPGGNSVTAEGDFTFRIVLAESHDESTDFTVSVDVYTVNKTAVGGTDDTYEFTIENVTGNITADMFDFGNLDYNSYDVTLTPAGADADYIFSDYAEAVNHGSAYNFTLTVSEAYKNTKPVVTATNGHTVTVTPRGASTNGVAQSGIYDCAVASVTDDFTVTVETQINVYTVTGKSGEGYTFEIPAGNTFKHGDPFTFHVTLLPSHTQCAGIFNVSTFGGVAVTAKALVSGTTYSFKINSLEKSITDGTVIFDANFERNTYTVDILTSLYTAEDEAQEEGDEGGTITPVSSVNSYEYGNSAAFTITPNSDPEEGSAYRLVRVQVRQKETVSFQDLEISSAAEYTFSLGNITFDTEIRAVFEQDDSVYYDVAFKQGTGYTLGAVSTSILADESSGDGEFTFGVIFDAAYTQHRDADAVVREIEDLVESDTAWIVESVTDSGNNTYTVNVDFTAVTEDIEITLKELSKNKYTVTDVTDDDTLYTITSNLYEDPTIVHGTAYTLNLTTETGYTQNAPVVLINGTAADITGSNGTWSCTVPSVTDDIEIEILPTVNTYTVTGKSGEGYTFEIPAGNTFEHGDPFTFHITLLPSHTQCAGTFNVLTFGGAAVTAKTPVSGTTYSFKINSLENSITDGTVVFDANFERNTYTVEAPAAAGLTYSAAASTVKDSGDFVFRVKLAASHTQSTGITAAVGSYTVNKTANPVDTDTYEFTIKNVTGNITADMFNFTGLSENTYTVTHSALSGTGYTVNKDALSASVAYDGTYTFTVTTNGNYTMHAPTVKNGAAEISGTRTEGNTWTYNIPNIKADIPAITVTANIDTFTVTHAALTGTGYDVVKGETTVEYNGGYIFKVTTNGIYTLLEPDVVVDGVQYYGTRDSGNTWTYTVNNIIENIDIAVTARKNVYSITTSILGEGTVTVPATVEHGGSVSLSMGFAAADYRIKADSLKITCDGTYDVAPALSSAVINYTISNITGHLTFEVVFELIPVRTVTFMNGGAIVAVYSGKAGTAVTTTHANPAPATGYEWNGWNNDLGLTTFTFGETNLIYDAGWTPIEYAINFDNDGDGGTFTMHSVSDKFTLGGTASNSLYIAGYSGDARPFWSVKVKDTAVWVPVNGVNLNDIITPAFIEAYAFNNAFIFKAEIIDTVDINVSITGGLNGTVYYSIGTGTNQTALTNGITAVRKNENADADDIVVTITPSLGYEITTANLDGGSKLGDVDADGALVITFKPADDVSLEIAFAAIQYKVVVIARTGDGTDELDGKETELEGFVSLASGSEQMRINEIAPSAFVENPSKDYNFINYLIVGKPIVIEKNDEDEDVEVYTEYTEFAPSFWQLNGRAVIFLDTFFIEYFEIKDTITVYAVYDALGSVQVDLDEADRNKVDIDINYTDENGTFYVDTPFDKNLFANGTYVNLRISPRGNYDITLVEFSDIDINNPKNEDSYKVFIENGAYVFTVPAGVDIVITLTVSAEAVNLVKEIRKADGSQAGDPNDLGNFAPGTKYSLPIEPGSAETGLVFVKWMLDVDGKWTEITGVKGITADGSKITEIDFSQMTAYLNSLNQIVLVAVFNEELKLTVSVFDNAQKVNGYLLYTEAGGEWTLYEGETTFVYGTKIQIRPAVHPYFTFAGCDGITDAVNNQGYVEFEMTQARDIVLNFESKEFTMVVKETSAGKGSIVYAASGEAEEIKFRIGETLSISFDVDTMYELGSVSINGKDISYYENKDMMFKNSTLTINVTVDWLQYAQDENLLVDNTFTADIKFDTKLSPVVTIGGSIAGVAALAIIIGLTVVVISIIRKKKDYAEALAKYKESEKRHNTAASISSMIKNAKEGE